MLLMLLMWQPGCLDEGFTNPVSTFHDTHPHTHTNLLMSLVLITLMVAINQWGGVGLLIAHFSVTIPERGHVPNSNVKTQVVFSPTAWHASFTSLLLRLNLPHLIASFSATRGSCGGALPAPWNTLLAHFISHFSGNNNWQNVFHIDV